MFIRLFCTIGVINHGFENIFIKFKKKIEIKIIKNVIFDVPCIVIVNLVFVVSTQADVFIKNNFFF